MKELREENKEFIRQKRQEARDAVDVMERSVEVKLAQERDRNGTFLFFFLVGLFSVSPPSLSFLSCFDLRPTNTRITPGLIVISAHYGLASSFTERGIIVSEKIDQEGEGEIIDVTIPVQALVQDGRLYIPGGKGKHNIIGFYVSFCIS